MRDLTPILVAGLVVYAVLQLQKAQKESSDRTSYAPAASGARTRAGRVADAASDVKDMYCENIDFLGLCG